MAKKWAAYDREKLEELYTSSRWSKRLSADVIVDEHVRVFTEGIIFNMLYNKLIPLPPLCTNN